MYADHQPAIAAFGRADPENFAKVITFALCSIRMPLGEAVLDIKYAWRGEACRSIFGAKLDGMREIRQNARMYYEQCEDAWFRSDNAEDELLHIFQTIPCLGPAKAGFCAQMLYGVSGCLDTHNLQRFGIGERQFRGREAKYAAITYSRKITEYNRLCAKLGGTAYLWDTWCEYLANRDPVNYRDADYVSSLHLSPLKV
jgi:hypothetical protein